MTEHQHTPALPGESAAFHFETTWWVPAEEERTWEVLSDISSWSAWWPGMSRSHRIGERACLVVRSPLGYSLRFTLELVHADAPRGARFMVHGDLRGVGSFTSTPEGDWTRVQIMWCVVTRRRLVGLLRPIARWAHAVVMNAGQRGLRRVS